jgi:integrase/recombinase XerD
MAKVHRDRTRGLSVIDEFSRPVPIVSDYLSYLTARDCSPNTVRAYAYDLAQFWCFLELKQLIWKDLTTELAVEFLMHLRRETSCQLGASRSLVLMTSDRKALPSRRSPATVNRALAAVSSFYEWAGMSGRWRGSNPISQADKRASFQVTDRYRPFLLGIRRGRPSARVLSVKTIRRLPRPLSGDQIERLFAELRCERDRALLHLMLDGGLRPGESLNLQLGDIAYGRRRVVIRWRTDHPRGVRSKSRTERVVDLHEDATLGAVTRYVMSERPPDASSPYVFLVGGRGDRRFQPLSYAALVRLFARACGRAGIRTPWITPQALRHTHASRMWEAGMRELTLQRRLGHASPESTRIYTRVPSEIVVAEYRRAVGLRPSRTVGSTGRRNTSLKSFCWRLVV